MSVKGLKITSSLEWLLQILRIMNFQCKESHRRGWSKEIMGRTRSKCNLEREKRKKTSRTDTSEKKEVPYGY